MKTSEMSEPPSEIDYAWAAGLLEGEGCFSIHQRSTRRNTKSVAIHCEMTDQDVIEKLHSVFGIGTVNLRANIHGRRDTRNRKPTWIWSVQSKIGVLEVIIRVLPYLGNRRRVKAQELLQHIENVGYDD